MTEDLSEDIKRRLAKLDALEEAGVENWAMYDSALSELKKTQEKRKYADEFINALVSILDEQKAIKPDRSNSWYVYKGTCDMAINYVLSQVEKFNYFEG